MAERHGITRHNPYKAARLTRQQTDPRVEAAMDQAKREAPALFQGIKEQEAVIHARQSKVDALFDDPAFIAMVEQLTAHVAKEKQGNMVPELALLGIDPGASKRDIRNAYRRKARKLHPDMGGDPEAFKQLHDAYRALLKVAQE